MTSSSTIVFRAPAHPENPSHLDFRDTSFFTGPNVHLPSPTDVLKQQACNPQRHNIVFFEDLGLAVKFGTHPRVHLDEALTMRALWEAFPRHEVPVPEVFGWRTEDIKRLARSKPIYDGSDQSPTRVLSVGLAL